MKKGEKIGVLFENTSKNGKKYFIGNILINNEKVKILGFEGEKQSKKLKYVQIYEAKENEIF